PTKLTARLYRPATRCWLVWPSSDRYGERNDHVECGPSLSVGTVTVYVGQLRRVIGQNHGRARARSYIYERSRIAGAAGERFNLSAATRFSAAVRRPASAPDG